MVDDYTVRAMWPDSHCLGWVQVLCAAFYVPFPLKGCRFSSGRHVGYCTVLHTPFHLMFHSQGV